MTAILTIHGVNQFDPDRAPAEAAARLGAVWTTALNHGLTVPVEGADVRMVYYADLLQPTGPVSQGAEGDLDHMSPEAAEAARHWAELHGVDLDQAQGRVLTPVRWVADAVARRKGLDRDAVRGLVARFFPDLVAYLHSPATRDAVQTRLAEAIERESPSVLIAHSLGSVVAYDTLWRHGLKVDALISIGSPLAMPDIVFPHLQHTCTAGKGSRPQGAGAWVNIADPGDLVAIPQPLTERFDKVTTNIRTGIGAFSFHKAANYLRNKATADAVARYVS
ncbi:hypothetical protein ACFYWN_29985 [Streptomyces sp. NPDC002917]|uniref:hypothetical protein n=1 Tax=Streptomyces sp. NPDC002917 TaxID=3364671 RepID=UPI0036791FCE